MTRLGIVGGAGRMGQTMARELDLDPEFDVVALIDLREPVSLGRAQWSSSIEQLPANQVDVIVDFSSPEVTRSVLQWCLENNVALVCGTTGVSSQEVASWQSSIAISNGHVLFSPNFSIGAVLSQRFAALAAPYFERVEIIELHHDQKIDAPSGTSIAAASMIGEARRRAGRDAQVDPTQHETIAHARGATGSEGVPIHSVRLPGLVAHQEILLGGPGEGLTIRHDSYDRVSFVAGVALAIRAVRTRPGLTVGLDELI
jgi:4-hydroxy-tetrahydrodipicolinate reductase